MGRDLPGLRAAAVVRAMTIAGERRAARQRAKKAARPMRPISTAAAERIARDYGYDQVVIIARRVGAAPEPHGEHVTTYGVDRAHCDSAAAQGRALKKFMGWPNE